jgi:hypothetical protein
MTERRDDELANLLRKARPGPLAGWRERALEAIAIAQPRRPGGWLRWAPTAAGVGLVVAALALLPYSASTPSVSVQTTLGTQSAYAAQGPEVAAGGERAKPRPLHTVQEQLRPYVERAGSFVRSRHSDDPRMLMAAGILTGEYQGDLSLLREAAEKGGGAEWAAYAGAAVWAGPEYASLALRGVDPRDPDSMRRVRDEYAAAGLPIALTEGEAAPVLEVLRGWERADPENGLPAALAVYYLHGLGREEEARESWEHASARTHMSLYVQETIWAMQRLLTNMGMSEWDSVSSGFSLGFEVRHSVVQMVRSGATIARHEGQRAGAEGRYEDAFAWWNATIALGRHMQESSNTLMEVLQAIAIEGVGAWEIWRWQRDTEGGKEGPLDGGRLYQGPAYGEFVSRYGEEAAREVRDSLVRAKLKSMMTKESYSRDVWTRLGGHFQAGTFLAISRWFGFLLVVYLLVWTGASLVGRRVADEATELSRWWAGAIALSSLLPIAALGVVMWRWEEMLFSPAGQAGGLSAIALSLLSPIFVPLIIVRWTRYGEARIRTVWRGDLRRVLPPAMAVCAAVSLCAGIAGMRVEKTWARDWQSRTEMERVVQTIGPEWHDPPIPADAWRNEPVA